MPSWQEEDKEEQGIRKQLNRKRARKQEETVTVVEKNEGGGKRW